MKKILSLILVFFTSFFAYGQKIDTLHYNIDEVSVVSFFNGGEANISELNKRDIIEANYGQDPSSILVKNPSIISLNDNGTEFGYGYFRIRGLDQTRINVMIDGCPWNEAEDFGAYFANSPDLMSSMENIAINRGTNSNNNGIAGAAGSINLESINIWHNNDSYAYLGGGSYGSIKTSINYNIAPTNGWGLHIKATHQQTDGYRDYGFNNSKAFTVKTGYKFNNRHSIDFLSMNGLHKNGQGWIGNTLEELKSNPRANGCTSVEDDNWFMSMNRLQYKGRVTNNIVLTSSVYYQYQTGSYRMDWNNYASKFMPEYISPNYILYDYALTHHLVGANVISKMYFNDLSLSVGVNGYTYNRRHYNGDKGVGVDVSEYYDNIGYKNDFNGFAVLTYSLINGLTIGSNIQYRYVNFDYKDNFDDSFVYNPSDYNTIWNFINWGLNINYTPFNNLILYAKYSCVNREPTRSDMFGGNEYFVGEIATITPEIANDFEIGTTYKNKKVNANINLYYMWFNNELILNGKLGANGLPCHENAKKSFRNGVEGSVNWNIWNNLYFDFNGSYSFNKVLSDTFGKSNHILTPNITLDSDFIWNNSTYKVGANINYRSLMYIDMDNSYNIPELFTLNLYGSIVYKNMEFNLRLNNVTNRTNYCTGMLDANNNILYIKNSGFNINSSLIVYF